MRQAGGEYLQEEGRLREAQPRVKAVLYPFELDCGLAPGSGDFVHTAFGGETGKLVLEEGYYPSASWTSPMMHTCSPHLNVAVPYWEEWAGSMDTRVSLRVAPTLEDLAASLYTALVPEAEVPLSPYYQVKVEFQPAGRCWTVDSEEEADDATAYAVEQSPDGGYESYAVDGVAPGYLSGLRLEGRLHLPESEILEVGAVKVDLAQDFSRLRGGQHVLVMDNRQGQWLYSSENFYLQGLDWLQKRLALYHGWELPNGRVEWQLTYQGVLRRLAGMAQGWQVKHRASLETQDWVAVRLREVIGAPSPEGESRPFMRGPYLARGELLQVDPAYVTDAVKTGSGSATLKILGTYRGEYPQDYCLEAENGGEVGTALCKWSINGGRSWKETGLITKGAETPVPLEEGLSVYWLGGAGSDLATGDRWTFTGQPPVYHYQVSGAPFAAITKVYLNGEETSDRVAGDAATGLVALTGRAAQVEARVVKDGATHPVDIITDILAEVGLSGAIHQDAFALAKSLTSGYALGVRFENLPAAQALREILQRCLFDLWLDFGEIKIRAYLGED
jgi:hypothetical protein